MARKHKRQERRDARDRKAMFLNDAVLRMHEPLEEATKESQVNDAVCLMLSNQKGQGYGRSSDV